MHPIERIRSLARATYLDPQTIAVEAADAIAQTCEWEADAAAVSVARRLLAWHPFVGPLWYAAGRMLRAVDATIEAARLADELIDDPTGLMLHAAIPEDARAIGVGRGPGIDNLDATSTSDSGSDLIVVGATAIGPGGVFAPSPAQRLAAAAQSTDGRVWVVAGRGSAVDSRLWDRLVALHDRGRSRPESRVVSHAWWDLDDFAPAREIELVPLEAVDFVCGPDGLVEPQQAIASPPQAPAELLDAAGADAF